jgi:hypothetical protein
MSRKWFSLAILLQIMTGCNNKEIQQSMQWRVKPDKDDKRPYSTWLAYHSLKYFFPTADIQPLSRGFRFNNMDDRMKYNSSGSTLLVLEGLDFYVTDEEWKELKSFAAKGNEVMIFCSRLDHKIEEDLNCYKRLGYEEAPRYNQVKTEGDTRHVLAFVDSPTKKYGYEGRSILGYFSQKTATHSYDFDETPSIDVTDSTTVDTASTYMGEPDTSTTLQDDSYNADALSFLYPDTLGMVGEDPDFLRYSIGDGHITLHAAPLVLSNYFLLQPGNEQYLQGIWQTLPENVNRIYWNDYYKRSSELSSMEILWRYPATRMALMIGIFALLMYVFFESKRRQKIVPIIAPLKNESVSFVETVGRLYYNKGNHANLADKMIQQFLEWVRNNHMLNTNLLNDTFVQQLAMRTGQPETTVKELVQMIHETRLRQTNIDEAYLYQLYSTIQQFYKNHHKSYGTNRSYQHTRH